MAYMIAVYVDSDTFTVTGVDRTDDFNPGRRIKASCGVDGLKYSWILSSSYAGPLTTVNLTSDGDSLTLNLTGVQFAQVDVEQDDRFFNKGEITTISGNIVDQIPTTAAEIIYDSTETIEEILDDIINTGVLDVITVDNDRGGLTIDWIGGAIFDHTTKTPIYTISGTGTAIDNTVNYLIWKTGTALSLGVTPADISKDEISIANLSAQTGFIHDITHTDILSERGTAMSDALDNILHVIVTSGLVVSENVDATYALDVECSAGTFYQDGHQRHDVSFITSSGTLMNRDFKTSSAWDSDTNAEIDTAYYNNGTDLAAAGTKWYKSLFVIATDHIHWVYPTVQYDNKMQALAAPLPTKPPGLSLFPNSVALVYQGGDAALPAAGGDQWIDVRPVIGLDTGAGAISDHGNLTGLTGDDHSQYHTDARGDARYYTQGEVDLKYDKAGGTISGDVIITGDLMVSGTEFITHTETVEIDDNLLLINANEVGAGVTKGWAGIEVDRGTEANYDFFFVEADDNFQIGVSGTTQPVATRKDSADMDDTFVTYWDAASYRLITDDSLAYSDIVSTATLTTTSGDLVTQLTVAADHGAAATDQVVNVSYGTGEAPAANTTTIGSLYIKYTE